ncbi:hypothetical protein L3Q82_002680 [Scortum barcoo]|uniref:Uncharacterized protein n=1 Tax=Scortum barcoo TaxID=214431 RepID=A0ACB8VU65_9TELE|nr:hypothetical protein L3Q82_002680 [Scortum barcoo]
MDTVVPVRSVRCFANNKPWITSDIKGLLNQKKKAFKDGDTQELKQIQKELRVQLREADAEGAVQKENQKEQEQRMQNNNMREVWEGMKTITGCSSKRGAPIEGDVGRANQLNQFFNSRHTSNKEDTSPPPPLTPSTMTIHSCSDYLTGRPQYVRLGDCRSDTVASSTGAPQGTVLSPVLFTLYTSDFQYKSEFCHVQKFADDTAIVGCIRSGQEDEYRELIKDFVTWCDLNHLLLNTTKTREMVVDFRRPRPHPEPVIIKGDCVEVVHTPTNTWECSWMINWTGLPTQTLCAGKDRACLYFLRRLASFNICKKLLCADLLPVCGSERPPVRSSVLGGQPQEEGRSAPGQTGEEGRLCRWHRAGQPDICGRATDAEQAPVHHRQSKSSTAQRHLQAEEQLQ